MTETQVYTEKEQEQPNIGSGKYNMTLKDESTEHQPGSVLLGDIYYDIQHPRRLT